MKKIIAFASLSLIMLGCSNEPEKKDYEETEYDVKISEFLKDKDWAVERQESGLYVYVEEAGSDEKPDLNSFLTLNYKGYFLDGTVFDGTDGTPTTFPFPVSNLIKGWQEGIPFFGKNGKGRLIVPPTIGYGVDGGGPIPPNKILVFDIEIIDFQSEKPTPKRVDYTPVIESYMKENNIDAKPTGSGLYIAIENEGGDEKPNLNSFLTLNYEGYLLNGNKFDGTDGTPTTFPFPMSNLIAGWQEGIPYLGKGGKAKLLIPPYLGYGGQDRPNIPANSVLVFDVEIIDFTDQQPK